MDCTAYESVLETLGHLLGLVDVEISTNTDSTRLPLYHLKNGSLRRLAIHQRAGPLSDPRQLISSLTTVFIQNPHLLHLELAMYGTPSLPFEDLFQNIPQNTLQLRSLLLSGWSIRVSPQVRPHLQSLTSVELPSSWNSDCVALWKFFNNCSSDTQLSFLRICCSDISEELLDLLQSRSMPYLEALEFTRAGADTDERSDHLAQRFYNNILCRYQGTLTELSLIPVYTGDWTIGFRNLDIFDEFKQLTKLSVGLDPSEIHPGGEGKDIVVRIHLSIYVDFLTETPFPQASFITRATRLPNLAFLSLHQVTSKSQRNAWCGTGILSAMEYIFDITQDSIEKTEVPVAFYLVRRRLRIVIPSPLTYMGESSVEYIPEADNGTSEMVRFRRYP